MKPAKTLVELTGAALPKQVSIKLLEAVAKLKLVEAAPALIVRLATLRSKCGRKRSRRWPVSGRKLMRLPHSSALSRMSTSESEWRP
jgi:hypothetical protein